jgi:hypothetical protein
MIALRFDETSEEERCKSGSLADEFFASSVAKDQELVVELNAGKTYQELLSALAAGHYGLRSFTRVEATLNQIFIDSVGAQADNLVAPRSGQAPEDTHA